MHSNRRCRRYRKPSCELLESRRMLSVDTGWVLGIGNEGSNRVVDGGMATGGGYYLAGYEEAQGGGFMPI